MRKITAVLSILLLGTVCLAQVAHYPTVELGYENADSKEFYYGSYFKMSKSFVYVQGEVPIADNMSLLAATKLSTFDSNGSGDTYYKVGCKFEIK